MVSAAEFARSTYGAWRLALFDAAGMQCFDDTVAAFWQSFQAAVILAPAYALLVVLRLSDLETDAGFLQILLAETIAYVIGWVAFPLAMLHVCDRMGRFDRYFRYIVAHNWSTVIQMAAFLAATILARGILPTGLGVALSLATTIAILGYQWFIARVALSIGRGGAAAVVGLDLVISVVLNWVTSHFL